MVAMDSGAAAAQCLAKRWSAGRLIENIVYFGRCFAYDAELSMTCMPR